MSDLPPLPDDKVRVVCKYFPDLTSPYCRLQNGCTSSNYADFDGAYIRRQRPYIARCIVTYRDGPVPPGTFCEVMVVEASEPGCGTITQGTRSVCDVSGGGDSSVGFTPTFSTNRSRLVRPPATSILFQTATQTLPDGTRRDVSYVDVPLYPPEVPTAVGVLFQCTINGVSRRIGPKYVVFANILQLSLRTAAPRPDCIEAAEQVAELHIIDPETGQSTPVEGLVPVRWEVRGPTDRGDRPFYSTDEIDAGDGIYSYARNGLAKNVFFGPACSVRWELFRCPTEIVEIPEVHAVKVSVVYDGLSAEDEKTISIRPFEAPPERVANKFLVEFNSFLQTIYADGYSYVEGRIVHDPDNTETTFSRCFRDCIYTNNGFIVPLSGGQIVSIESGEEFEIIYGDDLVITLDGNTNETVFSGGQRSIGFAEIPLSYNSNITKFYLRLYKNLGYYSETTRPGEQEDIQTACSCIRVSANLLDKRRVQLRARVTVLYNNQTLALTGGGGFSEGVPPTEIEIIEPLQINYIGIKRNDEFVEKFLCDGVSSHQLVFVVGFKGEPVPENTAVFITVGGKNVEKIAVVSSVVYTQTIIDAINGARSYVSVDLYPIMATASFEVQVQVECRYDKKGDIVRSATKCVTIKYEDKQTPPIVDPPEPPVVVIDDAYQNELYVYDTSLNKWETKKGPRLARASLSLTWAFDAYEEYLYAIGGINNNEIFTLVERYDINSDSWSQAASLNIPRFHHLSAFDGNYIYVFGGMTVQDQILTMAKSVERYDVYKDEWEIIGEMPQFDIDSYSIALGKGIVVGQKFYIIGGIKSVGSAGLIDSLNDRILIFDFETNEWNYSEKFSGVDFDIYSRVSPFAFLNSYANKIHVLGGAKVDASQQGQKTQNLLFPTDSFYIDLTDLSLHVDDAAYEQLPELRYKGESLSVMDKHYFIGGSTSTSSVSKTFEVIEENGRFFDYNKLPDFSKGITAFGAVSDDWRYLYVCAGLNSGRPQGFLQILADINPNEIKLDGKQTAILKIKLLDDVNKPPTKKVRVIVQGILVFLDTETGAGGQGDEQQQSADSVLKEALVYPVLFTNNDFYIENGEGSTVLKPRSEDILAKVSEIRKALSLNIAAGEGGENNGIKLTLRSGVGQERYPYKIKIRITVLDSFYYGQTVLDIKDNTSGVDTTENPGGDPDVINPSGPNDPPNGGPNTPPGGPPGPDVQPPTDTGGGGGTTGENFVDCAFVAANEISSFTPDPPIDQPDVGNPNQNNYTIQPSLRLQGNVLFSLSPPQTPQLASPEVSYYNDELWLPQVKILAQEADYAEMLKQLNILKNDIPYGASPIFDAIVLASEIQTSAVYDSLGKSFYINTDNEESFSRNNISNAIISMQTIDGYGKVPAIVSNFSVVFPLTLSALLARTDTSKLERIALETNGESVTIIDENNTDIVFNNLISSLQGGIGYGLFECLIDTSELSYISSIKLDFELFDNTDASWAYSISEDGYNYKPFSEAFSSLETAQIENIYAKNIKLRVNVISGLSASISEEYDLIPTAGAPALTQINIKYNKPAIKYLYLDIVEDELKSAQQVVLSVSANFNKFSQIHAGATSSKIRDWDSFNTVYKPVIEKHGKVFIPIRYKNEKLSYLDETLQRVDGYVYKAFYGPWDNNANIRIFDKENNLVSADEYNIYPNEGIVVFNSKRSDSYTISVENQSTLLIAIKFLNIDPTVPLEINSLGYLYNTNTFLPNPTSQRPPEIRNLNIVPIPVTVYDKISITYQYSDFNNDTEQNEKAKIKWYINGAEVEYLRNLRTWNDVTNETDPLYSYAFTFKKSDVPKETSIIDFARSKNESILRVNDKVYFTMQASDSNFLSNLAKSPTRVVIGSAPSIKNLQIKAIAANGRTSTTVTSQTNIVAEFEYYSDSPITTNLESIIIWYVNDVEFKRGNINKIVNGISNNRILVSERRNNYVALALGNVIRVEIIPKNGEFIGLTVVSEEITVSNVPPRVINVTVTPQPRAVATTNLQLTYTFVDIEATVTSLPQNDQSTIIWYKSIDNTRPFIAISALNNAKVVPSSYLQSGQRWKAVVTPFDGLGTGIEETSNTVTIV